MWSLPDIKQLNANAAKKWRKIRHKTEEQLCEGHRCEWCQKPATHALKYYDVFSDTPKGYVFLCDEHYNNGTYFENYFLCDNCARLHVLNYTWERYCTKDEDGCLCLNCAFDRHLENGKNWLYTVDDIDSETVYQAPHLIPVEGKHWKKRLKFIGNVEFDSMSGHSISGGGIDELKELVKRGIEQYGKAMLILDAAYQFAVSIGVYVPKVRA